MQLQIWNFSKNQLKQKLFLQMPPTYEMYIQNSNTRCLTIFCIRSGILNTWNINILKIKVNVLNLFSLTLIMNYTWTSLLSFSSSIMICFLLSFTSANCLAESKTTNLMFILVQWYCNTFHSIHIYAKKVYSDREKDPSPIVNLLNFLHNTTRHTT